MSSKALLLLFVFYTALAIVYCGSVNIGDCDKYCLKGGVEKCCNDHQYKRGHCGGVPLLSNKAWCDDHY